MSEAFVREVQKYEVEIQCNINEDLGQYAPEEEEDESSNPVYNITPKPDVKVIKL